MGGTLEGWVLTDAVTTSRTTTRPRWRLLRALVVTVLALLLVFFAGGGWYFSDRIRSDGLEVKPYPVERTLTLTPQASGTVSIRSTDPNQLTMLRAPSTYGVKWRRGGYGRVSGPVVSAGRGLVTRRLELSTRGHSWCSRGVRFMEGQCLDGYYDDVESVVSRRPGRILFGCVIVCAPMKSVMPESSLLVRLRWVSLAILALSVMLTVTVMISPIRAAR